MLQEVYKRIPQLKQEDSQLLLNCITVANCLRSSDDRINALGKLEKAMVDKIEKTLESPGLLTPEKKANLAGQFLQRQKSRYWQDQTSVLSKPLPDEYRHVLNNVLTDQEKKIGLTNLKTYLGFIQPDTFRKQVTLGTTWKDPTVPGGHGEFTHRIQWYIVANADKKPTQLKEFYCWIGTQKHTGIVEGDKNEWIKLGLWDALVDRNRAKYDNQNGPYNTRREDDFRSPENLTDYILKHQQEYPLLNAFIKGREGKRQWLRSNKDKILDYYARKVYNKSYQQLSNTDRGIIDRLYQNPQAQAIVTPGVYQNQTPDKTILETIEELGTKLISIFSG